MFSTWFSITLTSWLTILVDLTSRSNPPFPPYKVEAAVCLPMGLRT